MMSKFNEDEWHYETSSGYSGYRNKVTGEWISYHDYNDLKTFSMFVESSAKKAEELLNYYKSHEYRSSPADLVADIIHWCRKNKIDFDEVLKTANQYVTADCEEQKNS